METVSIGCRLPNGYVIEVGLETTFKGGPHNRPIERVVKTPGKYKRIRLGGTHDHTRAMRRSGIQTPAMLNAEPFITRGVPKEAWDEWVRKHPASWMLSSGNIFEVKGGQSNERAAILDSQGKPAILQPIDPTKALKVGGETVEMAEFQPAIQAPAPAPVKA